MFTIKFLNHQCKPLYKKIITDNAQQQGTAHILNFCWAVRLGMEIRMFLMSQTQGTELFLPVPNLEAK